MQAGSEFTGNYGADHLIRKPFDFEDATNCGVPFDEAGFLAIRVNEVLRWPPVEAWREISQGILRPEHPFALHRQLFEAAFYDWDVSQGPAPAWTPTNDGIRETHVGRLMAERDFASVAELHAWSVADRSGFWEHMIRNEADYARHVEYCYINPVKHGLVTRVRDWPHSSFHRDVRAGLFPADCSGGIEPAGEYGERA